MDTDIPLVADVVFQYLFGSADSSPELCSFLSAVQTDSGFPRLSEATIANPFDLRRFAADKLTIIDVRATDEQGRRYNVEVQLRSQQAFAERTLYYWAKSYSEQLKKGGNYRRLRPVVGVNVVDYVQFPDTDRSHTCYLLKEQENHEWVLTMDCVLHFLELPKVRRRIRTEVERWLYYLSHGMNEEDETVKVLLDENEAIRSTQERYRRFLNNEEARAAYEARQKYLRDHATEVEAAREEGVAQGIEQGIKQGIERGADAERNEVARAMKEAGEPAERIARFTGLTVGEIAKL